MSFDAFAFDARIMSGIRAAGYQTPTPIQTQAMAHVLAGKDLLGLAQTGTGKTAAFALPILQRLLQENARTRGPVRVLVLAPTRELALQIHETFVTLGQQTGMRSAAVFGGVGFGPQLRAVGQATIIVACPGRLLDLLERRAVDLRGVHTLVLDEADRMFDMGFMPQLKKILAHIPAQRQNLLFSATMPEEVRRLCHGVLRQPALVQVANTAPAAGVSHALYPVATHQKADFLEAWLQATDHDCVLVFTRTKHRAKSLAQRLDKAGWRATSLQGNLSQNRRQEALDGFRTGQYRILVATDIAARGIDCVRISHVVNYDLPDTGETYTHRIGRTGRAERSGEAITLVTPEDQAGVRAIERTLDQAIERRRLAGFAYEAATSATDLRDDRPPLPGRRSRERFSSERREQRPAGGHGQRRGRPAARPAPGR